MYAIIVDGGRQYRVEPGMEVDVDYRDVPQGESLTFEKVLAVSGDDGLQLGSPTVDGASVTASIIGPKMDKKIYVQKFRRRKNSRRRTGHRQMHTRVRIEKIMTEVEQIRAQGYGYTENLPFLGGATLCVLLPVTIQNQPVALGLGGVAERVRANRENYLAALQRAAKSIHPSDPFDMPIDIGICGTQTGV